uniref:Uncharacterized protein n=1 Tax=Setaria italica TaxID=4555 RepID=K3XUN3_SETIT
MLLVSNVGRNMARSYHSAHYHALSASVIKTSPNSATQEAAPSLVHTAAPRGRASAVLPRMPASFCRR